MATATARVGYAAGRTLFYGRAAPRSKTAASSATCFNPQGGALNVPNLCANQAGVVFANGAGFGTSSTRVGWTIGYGTEFDLGKNWSAKAEYDYHLVRQPHGAGVRRHHDHARPVRHQPGEGRLELPLYARNGGRRQVLMPGQPAAPGPTEFRV